MACTVHISVPTHIEACFCISLWCLCLSLSVLRWKSIRTCSRLLAPLSGITLTFRATHSLHYTLSNSYMMIRSPRLCSHLPTHRRLTALRPQALCPAHSYHTVGSQVPAGPTRNVTGEVMPTSLALAVTQLSFLEFLQRCNLLITPPPQPPQLPVPISLLDAAVQTTPPSDASQDVSTPTSDQPVSSLSLDVALHTPFHSVHILSLDAAVQTLQHSTASQDVFTQMGTRPASSLSFDAAVQTLLRSTVSHDTSTQLPLKEFFIGCIFSNDPFDCQGSSSAQGDTGSASPPQPPDIATTCSLSSSSLDRDGHVRTMAPRVLLEPPPGLEQYAPAQGLDNDAHLCASHGIPVKEAPLRPPSMFSYLSHASHSLLFAPSMWEQHPVRSATTGKRIASTALAGTHNPVDTEPSCRDWPFS